MINSILNSFNDETMVDTFTKPLRGVLGGKHFSVNNSNQDSAIMNVWQRALAAIILFTLALPYTAIAGIMLLFKPKVSLNEASLSIIFQGSTIDPNAKDLPERREFYGNIDADFYREITAPTMLRVTVDNTNVLQLVIPYTNENHKRQTLVFQKHPNDLSRSAAWSIIKVGIISDIHFPLHNPKSSPDFEEINQILRKL